MILGSSSSNNNLGYRQSSNRSLIQKQGFGSSQSILLSHGQAPHSHSSNPRQALGSSRSLGQKQGFGSSHSLDRNQRSLGSAQSLKHRQVYGSSHSLSRSQGYGGSNPSLGVGSSRGIVRGALGEVNIDMAISNFHIEFEVPGARYKPGDELSGKVIMDVWAGIDIKHVEFLINGKGTLRMFQNSSTFIERPKHEVYLDKKIVLIGSSTSNRGITLEPGRYETNFQYTLPENIPPSVHQFDMGNGYVFDISYSVQARVCDFAHARGPPGTMLRVVKATRKSFSMVPLQDWHTIPGAMEPSVHSEQLLLFCGAGRRDPTTVIVMLDHGIYPVGDNIRLTTEVISPGKDAIKDISAELEQQLFFDSDLIKKFRRVMIKALDDGRNRRLTKNGASLKSTFGISLPTNIIPSYLPNCKMIDLQYTMKVKVRFKKFGGKLIIRLPVVIAPACDGDRKDGEVPLFNKPVMQFPYFSKSPLGNGQSIGYPNSSSASDDSTRGSLHRAEVARGQQQDNVTTKYKTAFSCCGCCLPCLGFGILES